MARKLRVESPGAGDQIMNRGDRCEAIFRDVRLRAELVMPVTWIAEWLPMGTPGYVNPRLHRQWKTAEKAKSGSASNCARAFAKLGHCLNFNN